MNNEEPNIEPAAPKAESRPPERSGKSVSTSAAPMVSLREALEFITKIHERGLEREDMPNVAKGLDYSSPSSTPFYRRIAAARHFQLISPRGVDLTDLGLECIKPTTDEGSQPAKAQAVRGVAFYAPLLENFRGKRLVLDTLKNRFERELGIVEAAAGTCARAFLESLREAELLDANDILRVASSHAASSGEELRPAAPATPAPTTPPPPSPKESGHRSELLLDRAGTRKFIIYSPSTVTTGELQRIRSWLEFQLFVDDTTPASPEATFARTPPPADADAEDNRPGE